MAEIKIDTVKFTHDELKILYASMTVAKTALMRPRSYPGVYEFHMNQREAINEISNLMVVLETYFAGEEIPKAQCPTCGMRGTTPCVRGRKFSTIWDKKEPLGKSHDSRVAADKQEKWMARQELIHLLETTTSEAAREVAGWPS